ncbi:hypothetical protein [Methylobacterium fujisawaense]|uniref:hypothetical protein n=1 Tax=Methylobacterium fujisawaense TaxID=107400 RepID=UPI00313B7D28
MKIALYIEDGLEQVVLTPENDTEKAILGKMHDGSRDLTIKRGAFYACMGGWVRQPQVYHGEFGTSRNREDDSTMVVLRPAAPKPPALDLAGLADVARAEVENAVPSFFGDDPQARAFAELWQRDVANAVYAVIVSQQSGA